MRKMKKIFSAGLALIMCLSVLSVVAFATANPTELDETGPIDVHVDGELWTDTGNTIELSSLADADGPYDVEGTPDVITGRNINQSGKITLGKGGSKTYSFNVNGGWFAPDHNTVSVVITKVSGGNYQYISEDVTNDRELANETYSGNANRTISNLVPGNTYEVTLINLGTDDLNVRGTVTDPAGVQHLFTDYVVEINGNLQLDASVAYLRFPAEGDYSFSISVQDKYGAWSNWGRFIVQVRSGNLVFSNVTITGDTGLAPVDPIPSTSACRWMDYGMTLALAKDESLTPDEIWLFSTSFTPPNGLSGHYLGHYFIISGYLKYADGTPKANTTVDIKIPLTNTLYYSLPNSTFRATAVTNSNGYFSYKCGSITEYFNKLGYSSVSLTSGIGTFSNSAFVGSLNSMAFIVDTNLYLSTSVGGSYSCPVMGTVGYWPQAMIN